MSFKFKLSAKDRASARFIDQVQRELARAIVNAKVEKGMSQKQIADKLGVNKSHISRMLNGNPNLTLRTLAEVSWALEMIPKLSIDNIEPVKNKNWVPNQQKGASSVKSETSKRSSQAGATKNVTTPNKVFLNI